MQNASVVLYCHLWPVWLHHIFPLYLINGTIFGNKLLNTKCVLCFYLQLLSETFLTVRKIQRDVVINMRTSSYKLSVILGIFKWNLNFMNRFSKKVNIGFNKNLFSESRVVPCGRTDEQIDRKTDRRTDRHNEVNSCFSQFCKRS
jgi:hypothetical protein